MSDKTYPVIEVFGPTVQGEGPAAGRLVSFVRFGGCDFRCSWCDSLYAVLPAEVRANSKKLTAAEIVSELPASHTVILSGGNPALIDGDQLASAITDSGRVFHVETQGTRWKSWLGRAELLVVSPKPPSSGMAEKAEAALPAFVGAWRRAAANGCGAGMVLKFVVADSTDLKWALDQRDIVDPDYSLPLYLSSLTPPECSVEVLAASYGQLCDMVLASPRAQRHSPVMLPQLHVVAWSHARGV